MKGYRGKLVVKLWLSYLIVICLIFGLSNPSNGYYTSSLGRAYYGFSNGLYGGGLYGNSLYGGLNSMGLYGLSGMYGLGGLGGLSGLSSLSSLGGLYGRGLYGGFLGMGGLYGLGGMYGLGGLYGLSGLSGLSSISSLSGLYGGGIYGGLLGMGGLYGLGGMYGLGGLSGLGMMGMMNPLLSLAGLNLGGSSAVPATSPAPSATSVIAAEQVGAWLGNWYLGFLYGDMTLILLENPLSGYIEGTATLTGNLALPNPVVQVYGTVTPYSIDVSGIDAAGSLALTLNGILVSPTEMTGTWTVASISTGAVVKNGTGTFELTLVNAPTI